MCRGETNGFKRYKMASNVMAGMDLFLGTHAHKVLPVPGAQAHSQPTQVRLAQMCAHLHMNEHMKGVLASLVSPSRGYDRTMHGKGNTR